MFVKVDDNTYVNLLHVSEVIILNNGDMRVFMDDGATTHDVTGDFKENLKYSFSHWKHAVQRLASGSF